LCLFSDTASYTDGLAGAIRKECPDGIDIYYDNGNLFITIFFNCSLYLVNECDNCMVWCNVIVGGETLDIVLLQINKFARIIYCGAISQYNTTTPYGLKNTFQLIVNSGSLTGFIVTNYMSRFKEGTDYLSQLLLAKQLKYHEHIIEGVENAPAGLPSISSFFIVSLTHTYYLECIALLKLFDGSNDGKLLIKIA
jgi:NADPH-dependent curcumin reductase CurA